jgi:DNA-binding transcriptional MocR family regulator
MQQTLTMGVGEVGTSPPSGLVANHEMDAALIRWLCAAVAASVAYVPGAASYSAQACDNTLRLGFVTVDSARIDEGVQLLGGVLGWALEGQGIRVGAG